MATMATKQIHQYTAASTIDGAADYLLIDPSSTGTYNKINRNVLLGITSTPIGASDSQALQNKTLDNTNSITVKDGSFTLNNTSDTTKKAVFSAAGITTGTTRTLTLPNRTDTLVTLAGTETLTNKTITSPTISGGTVDNASITVDSISGHTTAANVTVGGVALNNGIVSTSGSVTALSIASGGVQPQALVAGTGTGWAMTSFTPTWTNLTVGNGTNSAVYIQVGKIVFLRFQFTWGSTSALSGEPSFVLPTTIKNSLLGNASTPLGWASLNLGGVEYNAEALYYSGVANSCLIRAFSAASSFLVPSSLSSTSPVNPMSVAGNTMSAQLWYETS